MVNKTAQVIQQNVEAEPPVINGDNDGNKAAVVGVSAALGVLLLASFGFNCHMRKRMKEENVPFLPVSQISVASADTESSLDEA